MCTTPVGTTDALTCLPPLVLVVQGEAGSAAHRLWSLGCWSYLQPYHGTAVHWCGFTRRIPYLIWGSMIWNQHLISNPSIELLWWPEKTGPEDLGLLPQWSGSSGIQMDPRRWWRPGPESMDSLEEEGSRKICYLGLCLQNSNEH